MGEVKKGEVSTMSNKVSTLDEVSTMDEVSSWTRYSLGDMLTSAGNLGNELTSADFGDLHVMAISSTIGNISPSAQHSNGEVHHILKLISSSSSPLPQAHLILRLIGEMSTMGEARTMGEVKIMDEVNPYFYGHPFLASFIWPQLTLLLQYTCQPCSVVLIRFLGHSWRGSQIAGLGEVPPSSP
ncbi:hypothetical protein Acr_04g0002280 [Actinidia rufa]|uniref:Uncharacterized protein n=1 Tax=Actinidia rufa TaxID=165716 RepID=A0A7J0EGI3_9ERIC|nr:hypothetical protein Acr_04g0002280 [Actinidia rufa]